MKKLLVSLIAGALMVCTAAAQQKARKPGLYAVFDTSMGTFVCELYEKNAPLAVENFVGLAEGTKEWLTPKDVVQKVSEVPVGPAKKPAKDVIINKVTIERVGKPAR